MISSQDKSITSCDMQDYSIDWFMLFTDGKDDETPNLQNREIVQNNAKQNKTIAKNTIMHDLVYTELHVYGVYLFFV